MEIFHNSVRKALLLVFSTAVFTSLMVNPLLINPAAADAALTPEQSGSDSAAVAQLTELLETIDTFQADVRQLIVESTGGVLEESEIKFILKRPHGFYWETLEPYPELIVTDGNKLWNYQPDLLQVTVEDWDPDRSELAAQLLSGQTGEIAQEYNVSAQSAAEGQDWEFFLVPLDPGSIYERVTLYFEGGELDSMHIISGNGQRTLWQFYNQTVNEAVADDVFIFSPPDDIEVIDNSRSN
jgi:outer membrane lipoprotein carrier protein